MTRGFDAIVEEALKDQWETWPVSATFAGVRGYDDRLGDFSPDFVGDRVRAKKSLIRRLKAMPRPGDREAALDHRVMLDGLEVQVAELEERGSLEKDPSLYPFNAMHAIHTLLLKDLPRDYRDEMIRARTRQVPRTLEQGRRNIRRPDAVLSKLALEAAEDGKAFFEESVKPLDPEGAAAAQRALDEYAAFLRRNVLPRCRTTYPIGRDLFEFKLRKEHGLSYDVKDLREIGSACVRRAQAEMESLARRVDPHAGWRGVLARLKREFPSPSGLVEAYRRETARARAFAADKGIVSFPRGESLKLLPTPRFEWSMTPYAAMMPPGPFEKSRKSLFWVTPVDPAWSRRRQVEKLRGHCVYGIPVTCVHEGYPGHHIQLTRANLIRSKVRRVFYTSLFAEGWAFYCEGLMEELGYLSDPRVRLYRLKDELWRACRIVVDVGLHTGRLGYRQAVDLLVDEAALERPNAEAEVNRYCSTPTEPMSYLIGKLEILKLRDACWRAWGPRYGLRRFHDWMLDHGTIPPPLMAP